MKGKAININKDLKTYILLWSTQSLSALGSGMTSYALVLWLYSQSGSALKTALLTVCSYAPYVLMSIFAGALSDKWNKKKTMLVCDLLAALCTVSVLLLIKTNNLALWHLYLVNAVNGLMNTVQQPASEVASTLLIPEEYYQKTSGLRSFSQSLNSVLTPIIASALYAFVGIGGVIAVDLATFAVAFIVLWLFIKIPEKNMPQSAHTPLLKSARQGMSWLNGNRLILTLIVFLACINLVASVYEAMLPALIIPKSGGKETVLGAVNAFAGIATMAGSIITALLPTPKNRVKVICTTLLFSMSTENFILAFTDNTVLWCIGAFLGWIGIPLMNANMDVIFRTEIPVDMQGRVFACRNTLQFFTIPLGYFLGGISVDRVFEPFMAMQKHDSVLTNLFGVGKGAGTALLSAVIGVVGVAVCLVFTALLRKYKWNEFSVNKAAEN